MLVHAICGAWARLHLLTFFFLICCAISSFGCSVQYYECLGFYRGRTEEFAVFTSLLYLCVYQSLGGTIFFSPVGVECPPCVCSWWCLLVRWARAFVLWECFTSTSRPAQKAYAVTVLCDLRHVCKLPFTIALVEVIGKQRKAWNSRTMDAKMIEHLTSWAFIGSYPFQILALCFSCVGADLSSRRQTAWWTSEDLRIPLSQWRRTRLFCFRD